MTQSVLEIGQIIASFPDSYVLVDHCKFNEHGELTHGHVVCSRSEQDDVYRQLHECPNSIVIYTGRLGEEADGAYLDKGSVWEAVVEA